MNNLNVIFSSNKDEWYTPEWIFKELDSEFNFDLDPCATKESAKCEQYFDKEHDGLKADWGA